MTNAIRAALTAAALVFGSAGQAVASDGKAPVTDSQIALMIFDDYGRSYGYQSMLAQN